MSVPDSTQILLVCLGNICRSPMAEAILDFKAKNLGLKVKVDSCGTGNWHIGQQPDPRTIAVANHHGVPVNHRARQIELLDFERFDYIFAMDDQNYRNLVLLTDKEEHHRKILKIRQFDPVEPGGDVPDPYYGTDRDFQLVFEMLNRTIDEFLTQEFRINN